MNWGYYCRTCGVSSRPFYASAEDPRRDIKAMYPVITKMVEGDDDTLPTVQVAVAIFLSHHEGHDLWAECDVGVLRLTRGVAPVGPPRLPRCIGAASGSS